MGRLQDAKDLIDATLRSAADVGYPEIATVTLNGKAAERGISKGTVRRALGALEMSGAIERSGPPNRIRWSWVTDARRAQRHAGEQERQLAKEITDRMIALGYNATQKGTRVELSVDTALLLVRQIEAADREAAPPPPGCDCLTTAPGLQCPEHGPGSDLQRDTTEAAREYDRLGQAGPVLRCGADVPEPMLRHYDASGSPVEIPAVTTEINRGIVVACLHHEGALRDKLTEDQRAAARQMCDGFERAAVELDELLLWDWSHVRDSSPVALAMCASYLRGELEM